MLPGLSKFLEIIGFELNVTELLSGMLFYKLIVKRLVERDKEGAGLILVYTDYVEVSLLTKSVHLRIIFKSF